MLIAVSPVESFWAVVLTDLYDSCQQQSVLMITLSHQQYMHVFADWHKNMNNVFENYVCCASHMHSGPRFNKKMPSYQYRNSHCGDKTVVRSSYLHNGISYTGKMTSLYWIRAQDSIFKMSVVSPEQSLFDSFYWKRLATPADGSENGLPPNWYVAII